MTDFSSWSGSAGALMSPSSGLGRRFDGVAGFGGLDGNGGAIVGRSDGSKDSKSERLFPRAVGLCQRFDTDVPVATPDGAIKVSSLRRDVQRRSRNKEAAR